MKQRIEYIDNAKGILIILMVVAHIFLECTLSQWIYVFHMPAFFIITGILFNYSKTINKKVYEIVVNKIYTILIPLIFCEVIGMFTYIIRYGFTQNIFGFVYNTLHYHFNNGPDWFLFVLFVVNIIFILLHKLIRNKWRCGIISTIIIIIAFLWPYSETEHWSVIPRSVGISFGMVTIGYYLYKYFEKKNIKACITCLISTTIICFMNGSVSLNVARVHNPILYIIGGICGTYVVLCLSQYIKFKPLAYIGKNSLIVMGTHQAILLPIRFYCNIPEFDILTGSLVLIWTMLLQFLICYLINRFLPFCVGKKFVNDKLLNLQVKDE